ncbi:MAG: hypothetical protein V3U98_11780 [Acidobacteriota bacterium]
MNGIGTAPIRRRWSRALAVALGAGVLASPAAPTAAPGHSELDNGAAALGPFQHGMTLGVYSRGSEEDLRPRVRELARLGFDSISLVVPVVLADVRSIDFYAEPTVTPSDEALRRAARLSHAMGMRVLLFPIVYVWELKEGEWRGTIDPADWDVWFERYGELILRYARLAREEGIEYFSVGSELCSSEAREQAWRELIARVRRQYPGALTYSANWDHRDVAQFFDALDFIGMNAYFRLSAGGGDPSDEELGRAWEPVIEEVESWAARWGKPLVVTEIGYPSRTGAAYDPWDYTLEGEPDASGQARLYRAFLSAWARVTGLSGVYFYLWWGEGGPHDAGYTPRGKAAEAVLREWLASAPERDEATHDEARSDHGGSPGGIRGLSLPGGGDRLFR